MIAHEVVGSGEPLLMIMGLSGTRKAWWRLLPHLTEHAECIVFDNRGTGDSPGVRGPLSMRDLVEDALSVLDATGHDSAHVLGVSMGGMIAQHLALDHRERVRSLVLGCTTPVGRSGLPPWRLLAATALRPVVGPGKTAPLLAPALYGERTRREHPERMREDLAKRLDEAVSARTSFAQMLAIGGHSTRDRLGELAGLDVTVIHGEDDALVPFERGVELAEGIPGARLVAIPACGHMLTTDAEEESAAAVVEHLQRVRAAAA
ncbi:MAG TPA: alpha/beta fold hydrolase [Capillimicrobium sp.]|nr:alpha/beta fold hydrolase [Capillimicrobium sp.]